MSDSGKFAGEVIQYYAKRNSRRCAVKKTDVREKFQSGLVKILILTFLISGKVLTQPFDPQVIGSITYGLTNCVDIKIGNGSIYANALLKGLSTYKLSDPENPVFVNQIKMPAGNFQYLAFSGNYLYASHDFSGSGTDYLVTFDVSDPSVSKIPSYVVAPSPNGKPNHLIIRNNRLYLLVTNNGSQRLQVYDLSAANSPVFMSELLLTMASSDLASIDDNTIIVVSNNGVIKTVNVSNPLNCSVIASVQTSSLANVVETSGNLAYVGTTTGLDVYNLSNVNLPAKIGTLSNGAGISDIQIVGENLFCAARANGFEIVSVANPANPANPQSLHVVSCGLAQSIAVKDNYAYVGTLYDGIQIIRTMAVIVAKTNQPPVASAGDDVTLEAFSSQGAEVTLNGSGSSDPDGDPLTYAWYENGNLIAGPSSDAQPKVTLALGTHQILLTVEDGKGATSSDGVVIRVADLKPPQISLVLNPEQLWPPNRKMMPVLAMVTVSDACDPNPSVQLSSIVNSEFVKGQGAAKKDDAIQGAEIGTADFEFFLRADRSGNGNGRSYLVTYTVTDASGNKAIVTDSVCVAHDQSQLNKGKFRPVTGGVPESYEMFQNYPNPFNPETVIQYGLPEQAPVLIEVYNIHGDRIAILKDGFESAGYHSVTWNGKDNMERAVSGGIYLCRIQAGNFRQTLRMSLLK
jgi:hypothetical protein